MKRLWSIVGFLLITALLHAQSNFEIKESSKGFYIEHKVAPKETFFSIGRTYNLHHQTIAKFNGLQTSKGLSKGQTLRIPLNDTNFDQRSGKGVPIYYIAKENEYASDVRTKFNVEGYHLQQWNRWMNFILPENRKAIVGFLKTSELKSLVIDRSESILPPEVEKVKTDGAEVKTPVTVPQKEQKKTEVIPVSNDSRTGVGFFRTDFEKQLRKFPLSTEQMVTSGIFKTTSGWQDAKYYMLIDKVEPGTIVRITNPINNKSIYAKVLYGMEGIRQNEGLDIRISNSAAAALEITDTEKFFVKVNY